MSKFFLFSILLWLTRSPLLAILLLLVILYVADRRFIGLLPNLVEPFRRARLKSQLQNDLRMNPNHTQAKVELARLLLQKKQFAEAYRLLEEARVIMRDSADILCELGYALLNMGRLAEGEVQIQEALRLNPRVKYGEPYLKVAEAFSATDREKAVRYLVEFQGINSSSCEAYYRLGSLFQQVGRQTEAKRAYQEAVDIYRSLPKYKKRTERKWALLSWMKR